MSVSDMRNDLFCTVVQFFSNRPDVNEEVLNKAIVDSKLDKKDVAEICAKAIQAIEERDRDNVKELIFNKFVDDHKEVLSNVSDCKKLYNAYRSISVTTNK